MDDSTTEGRVCTDAAHERTNDRYNETDNIARVETLPLRTNPRLRKRARTRIEAIIANSLTNADAETSQVTNNEDGGSSIDTFDIPTVDQYVQRQSMQATSSSPRNRNIRLHGAALISPDNPVPTMPYTIPLVAPCTYCQAKRFYREPKGFCCADGAISLAPYSSVPALWDLFMDADTVSSAFRQYVRSYNNAFAFTSMGVRCDKMLCSGELGIYTFRVQGQVHHYVNSLVPSQSPPTCLQLYFYDTDNEIGNRLLTSNKLSAPILSRLIVILSQNPFSRFFRSLQNINISAECSIIIRANTGLDQRVFNEPTASQVAAIWVDDETGLPPPRDIVVYSHPGFRHKIQYYFGCYDPLSYPLIFPLGESGWHQGIQRRVASNRRNMTANIAPNATEFSNVESFLNSEASVMESGSNSRNTVSCREYYCYRLQIRPGDRSVLLHSGRLFQQYVVDMYIKLETSRLDYFRLNQATIRAELYAGVLDSVAIGETAGRNVGHRVVLPPTFIGGPRDMRRRYIDAMTLVLKFGKPDLFITMTCNPSWPEITVELLPGEEAQNRPDLIARVFRAKLEELKEDLFKRHVLGHVAAHVYVVEFQKRGLPHAHFLLIMHSESKIKNVNEYDKYVSAEIPGPEYSQNLRESVRRHMMHGPCGSMKPNNVCMKKKGTCRNAYPKNYCEHTTQGLNSYPIYRRRDNKVKLLVRGHNLDNKWVVPYNPYLLMKFDCHLNVEICSTIKAVKYLYKYIYKGHDQVAFHLNMEQPTNNMDEIQTYQMGRWVSPPEAAWRLFRFTMNETSPAISALSLHLPDQQSVSFTAGSNLENVIANENSKKTMLTEYFRMNAIDENARLLFYKDFPTDYVWHMTPRNWKFRQRGISIGRIVTVNPSEGERYYLRLLLNATKGATSFEALRTVDGTVHQTFRNAALALGLLEADNSSQMCLAEAATYQMPSSMRRLFAILLVYCSPSNTRDLWNEFEQHMIDDFSNSPNISIDEARADALADVDLLLQSMGRQISNYDLPFSSASVNKTANSRELEDERTIVTPAEDLQLTNMLNQSQRIAFESIVEHIREKKPGIFFIDGPGGTGKTFLYRALLATVRSKGLIALATASSGVAASILPGGRTAHSRFKIPLSKEPLAECMVPKQGGLAKLLRTAALIIWDEAPMIRKQAMEAVDRLLQDVCDSRELFGGKTVVFGGDFRQVLPVLPKSTIQQTIDASLLTSYLWESMKKFKLSMNMRAREDTAFSQFLLDIGNGVKQHLVENEITLPSNMLVENSCENPLDNLIHATFPDLNMAFGEIFFLESRAILAAKNDVVNEINALLITKFQGTEVIYHSFDSPVADNVHEFQEDFCNTITPSGFPPHLLRLKVGCPVMLLRNLDPSKGMCNGTRLRCKSFEKNVIVAEVAAGTYKGNEILIPRIPLLPLESEDVPFPFKRTQFPITLCFAMTINKAQGQTLDFVGICLTQPVFSHGQLYVAMSRARNAASVKVLTCSSLNKQHAPNITRNVVYAEVLERCKL